MYLCIAVVTVILCTNVHWVNSGPSKVIYAVNAGGSEHTDSSGIHYL